MNTDNLSFMGKEKISKLMFKFSIPCVLSLLVSALYNIVDQIFIGNSELSALGNAATGAVFPIFIIAQAFAWCFGDGCAAYLSICQGKKDTENAHKAIGNGIIFTLVAALVVMALIYPFKTQILTILGASENSMAYAMEYLNLILSFFPFFMLSNMFISVIRADGSPTWAMVATLAGAITNIILDPVFIFGTKWGMFGAALATVIGQTVSFIISFLYIPKTKTFKLSLKSFIPNIKAFKGALQLGISSFITQITILIISLTCNMQLARYGGMSKYGVDIPIAIIGIESKVFTVVINLVVGIILGCQPIISYNIGAKKIDRVKELYKKILLCTIIIGIISTLVFEFCPRFVVGLFGSPNNIPNPNDYWEFGEKVFRIFVSLVTFTCFVKMTSIFFQAVGKPFKAILASLIRDIVCFVPLIFILPILLNGIDGILLAAPIADVIAMVIATTLTIKYMKSLDNQTLSKEENIIIEKSNPGIIITIAREHGSGGKQIGKLLAEKLNIPFYYKEMMYLAAKESGLDQEFISSIDDNSPSVLPNLYLGSSVIQQAVIAQDKIIRKIADSGSCVIVGRAADYVLREYDNVVRIFIYANHNYKIKRIMELYNDSYEEAKKYIKRSDEKRAAYYNNISNLTWGDKDNYDLLIDSSIGINETVDLIYTYINNLKK